MVTIGGKEGLKGERGKAGFSFMQLRRRRGYRTGLVKTLRDGSRKERGVKRVSIG